MKKIINYTFLLPSRGDEYEEIEKEISIDCVRLATKDGYIFGAAFKKLHGAMLQERYLPALETAAFSYQLRTSCSPNDEQFFYHYTQKGYSETSANNL